MARRVRPLRRSLPADGQHSSRYPRTRHSKHRTGVELRPRPSRPCLLHTLPLGPSPEQNPRNREGSSQHPYFDDLSGGRRYAKHSKSFSPGTCVHPRYGTCGSVGAGCAAAHAKPSGRPCVLLRRGPVAGGQPRRVRDADQAGCKHPGRACRGEPDQGLVHRRRHPGDTAAIHVPGDPELTERGGGTAGC